MKDGREGRDFDNIMGIVALHQLQGEDLARITKHVGNVLDHWEQLPNDLKGDSGMEALGMALDALNEAVEGRDGEGESV